MNFNLSFPGAVTQSRGESYLEGKPAMHLCIHKDRGVFHWTYRDALINYSVRIVENAPKTLQCRKIFCGEREGEVGVCPQKTPKGIRSLLLRCHSEIPS